MTVGENIGAAQPPEVLNWRKKLSAASVEQGNDVIQRKLEAAREDHGTHH
jgi:hypothetical protein